MLRPIPSSIFFTRLRLTPNLTGNFSNSFNITGNFSKNTFWCEEYLPCAWAHVWETKLLTMNPVRYRKLLFWWKGYGISSVIYRVPSPRNIIACDLFYRKQNQSSVQTSEEKLFPYKNLSVFDILLKISQIIFKKNISKNYETVLFL